MSRFAGYAYIAITLVVLSSSLAACSFHVPAPVSHLFSDDTFNLAINGAQHFQTIDGFGVNANSLP